MTRKIMITTGQNIQGTVEKLVFGGKGLLRHEGLVVFVDDVLPGEEVVVCITEKKRSYCNARLVNLVTSSPLRISPRCPHFGVCGGCQLQHISYETQAEIKKEWLKDFFQRGLKVDVPIFFEKTLTPWAYRRKVTLHARFCNQKVTFGYFASDNTTLFDVSVCPIFIDEKDSFLQEVRTFLESLSFVPDCDADVLLCNIDGKKSVVITLFSLLDNKIFENTRSPTTWTSCQILTKSAPKKAAFRRRYPSKEGFAAHCAPSLDGESLSREQKESEYEVSRCKSQVFRSCGFTLFYSPEIFIQNHPQSESLYQEIVLCAKEAAPRSIYDLYCGIGLSTLLLAKEGFTVVGVEGNRESVVFAKKNAQENGIETTFVSSSCEAWLRRCVRRDKGDMWIVNPPRDGLSKEVLREIEGQAPHHLIYISCMPPTLIRDLAVLKEHYEIVHVKGYDLFPQTAHLETLVFMKKKGS